MEIEKHENLDQLFKQLSKGETPNFLQMMAAISDVSTIFPEPQEAVSPSSQPENVVCQASLGADAGIRCSNCG